MDQLNTTSEMCDIFLDINRLYSSQIELVQNHSYIQYKTVKNYMYGNGYQVSKRYRNFGLAEGSSIH